MFDCCFMEGYLKRLCILLLCSGLVQLQALDDDGNLTLDDFRGKAQEIGRTAYGLKQRTVALRLHGGANLERGILLAGAGELADAVRMLMDAGIRYQEHPEDEPEVLREVLIQLDYLEQHTAAEFQDQEHWNAVRLRLLAMGAPAYALAEVVIGVYLPAVEGANEIAGAEARLTQAVQRLFNAFLLLDVEEEEGLEDEEDSDGGDDDSEADAFESDESSEYESGEEYSGDSEEYSTDSEDTVDEGEVYSGGESDEYSSEDDVLSCDSGYCGDQSSDGEKMQEWLGVRETGCLWAEGLYGLEDVDSRAYPVSDLEGYANRRKALDLSFPSSASSVSFII